VGRGKQARPEPGRALTNQLPESGFPSGLRTPSTTLLLLLFLLTGLCVVLLDVRESGTISAAVAESQEQLVSGAGASIGASASQGVADLRTATAIPAATPEELLTRVTQNRTWRGVAVLDAATRALVATRGEPVPVQALPATVTGTLVTPVVGADGALRIVVAEALPNARLVVAVRGAQLPDASIGGDPREALLLTTSAGQVLDSRGERPRQDDKKLNRLVELASAAAVDSGPASVTGPPVRGRNGDAEQLTVAYTPVSSSGLTGGLGLAVVSIVRVPVAEGGPGGTGVVPAVALGGVAVLGFLLVYLVLVRPTRRLRADALAVASGRLTVRVRRSATPEVRRIAAAFEHCRSTLSRSPARTVARRRGMPAGLAVLLAALAVLGWSTGVLLTIGSRDVAVPGAVVTSVRNQTTAATEALRRSVNDGLADLVAVASLAAGKAPAEARPALERLVAGQSRYRSVYLVDQNGRATTVVGRTPLRADEPPPAEAGIRQQNASGPVPVLFAHAPLPAGGQAVVGEFDLDHLGRLLGRAPGAARLVDSGLRTIAATDGFVAFAELGGDELRRSATDAGQGEPVARVQEGSGGRAVVASAALRGGASGKLGWTVVAEQPVAELALAGNELRRNGMVVALVGALLALLMFGWQYLILVRPLRRVAAAADEIVAGRHGSVIYPQHQDQIGTIASCLEICRQALTEGVGRLGAVRRPRGAATDVTELIPIVPPQGRANRDGRSRRPTRARRAHPNGLRQGVR
jgi:methyl-accepting chemotaxis protein